MIRKPLNWLLMAVAAASLTAGAVALNGCNSEARASVYGPAGRLLIVGMDGLDPKLLKGMMDAGKLPNFSRLAAQGTFKPLGTIMPPQSPVAWATFISGAHPGKHQIYDFLRRKLKPATPGLVVEPAFSESEIVPAQPPWFLFGYHEIPWGSSTADWGKDWRIPLLSEEQQSLRHGDKFWNHLVAHGIDTTVYRVPANYPPGKASGSGDFCCISGMGTPDTRGSLGEFFMFSEQESAAGRDVGGGMFRRISMIENRGRATLEGPPNHLKRPKRNRIPKMNVEFDVVRDPSDNVARIDILRPRDDDDRSLATQAEPREIAQSIILAQGEWSDWIPFSFETGVPLKPAVQALMVPTEIPAMVRFYLRKVHPTLELYASPLNIDPLRPANDISTPASFAGDVASAVGRYYTTGIPEDTASLRRGALTEDEFLQQSHLLLEERVRQYRRAIAEFTHGCLFFYFGSTDQLAHIFWRDRDPEHPGLKPGEAEKYGHVLDDLYVRMDGLLGEALATLSDSDTIIVMSDHGFSGFRWGFNVNTWLMNNGYLGVADRANAHLYPTLSGVDWSQTKAYAMGINSLFINVAGREQQGTVKPADKRAVMEEIAAKMLQVRGDADDPVIEKVYITEDIYPGADPLVAPDMLIGYAANYRGSWGTALGGISQRLIEPNLDRWSGDHCIAHYLVPGCLLTNRKVVIDDPTLADMAPTLLAVFGVPKPDTMSGRVIFQTP